jgi:hypothetical protein
VNDKNETKTPPTSTATVRRLINVLDKLDEAERQRVVNALSSLYLPQSGVRREA